MNWQKRLLELPLGKDPQLALQARLLWLILMAVLVAGGISLGITAAFDMTWTFTNLVWAMACSLIAMWLTYRGRVQVAAVLAWSSQIIFIAVVAWRGDGIHDVVNLFFPGVLLGAAVIFSRRNYIVFLAFTLLVALSIAYVETQGLLYQVRPVRESFWGTVLLMIVILLVTGVALRLLAEIIMLYLARAHANEQALDEKNRQMQASEARWRLLAENLPDRVLRVNHAGHIEFVNDPTSPQSLINTSLFETVSPAYHNEVQEALAETSTHARPTRCEVVARSRYGDYRWFDLRFSPVYVQNRVESIIVIATDISTHKAAQEELRRAEEARRVSEDLYRQLVEQIEDIIYAVDTSGIITYMSPVVQRKGGYRPEELIGHAFAEFVHPEDVPEVLEGFAHLATLGSHDREFRLVAKDGTLYWARASARVVLDAGGQLVGIRGVLTDITDRKTIEESQRARVARLERQRAALALIANHPAIGRGDVAEGLQVITRHAGEAVQIARTSVWLFSEDWERFRCADLFEFPVGRHSVGLELQTEDYPRYFEALATGRAIEAENARTDSRTSEFTPNYLEPLGITSLLDAIVRVTGQVMGVVCLEHIGPPRAWHDDEASFATEVADQVALMLLNAARREADEALRTSEARLSAIINNTPTVAIQSYDEQGRILTWNRASEAIYGWTEAEVRGRTMSELGVVAKDDDMVSFIEKIKRSGRALGPVEFDYVSRSGFRGTVLSTMFAIPAPEGQHFICADVDITERKQAEAALARRVNELQTVSTLSTATATILETPELLDTVVNLTASSFGLYHVQIYLVTANQTRLELVAGSGALGRILRASAWSIPVNHPHSVVARAARQRQGVISNDVLNGDDFLPNPVLTATRSELAVPIIVGDQVLGVLDVQSDEQGRFNDNDIFIKSTLAAQVGVALRNAQLFTATRRQLDELTILHAVTSAGATALTEDELISRVTQSIGDSLYLGVFGVLLVEPQQDILRPHPSFRGWPPAAMQDIIPFGHRVVGQVAATGQVVRLADTRQHPQYYTVNPDMQSELCVPIRLGKRVLGVINAESPQRNAFSEEDERLLVTVAGQLATALDRLRADAELRRLNAQLEQRVAERTAQLEAANTQLALARDMAESANRAKSEFLANMSHELRTPLNSILGYTQILKRQPGLNETYVGWLNVVQKSGEHLLMVISDVLDLSKIEARKLDLQPTAVHLPGFINELAGIVRLKAEQKGLHFAYEAFTPLPLGVRVDEKRLRQVLLNLLDNAIKYTDTGGVTFRVGLLRTDTPQNQAIIRFEVIDTGIGISPGQQARLFQAFEQVGDRRRHVDGTGLGLAISRYLAQAMGGEVYVRSEPDLGSTFWLDIALPLVEMVAPPSNSAGDQAIIGYQGERRTVLVVDDIADNRHVLAHVLAPLGFNIVEAHNGLEAVAQTEAVQPDLVLMDIVMPNVTGLEATQEIRRRPLTRQPVIIAISASVLENDQSQSLNAGCDAFLPKPVDVDALLNLLATLLRLQWIYATPAITDTPSGEAALLLPPKADVHALMALAQRGDVEGIQTYAETLLARDARYAPFAERLRQFARAFETEQLLRFIEENLVEKPLP